MIEAGLRRYEQVDDEIKKELSKKNKVTVKNVNGQRYIGCALDEGKTIEVYGTPGNDMACYLNGGRVVVYGSCQDAVGNTWAAAKSLSTVTAATLWAMVCATVKFILRIMLPAAAVFI